MTRLLPDEEWRKPKRIGKLRPYDGMEPPALSTERAGSLNRGSFFDKIIKRKIYERRQK